MALLRLLKRSLIGKKLKFFCVLIISIYMYSQQTTRKSTVILEDNELKIKVKQLNKQQTIHNANYLDSNKATSLLVILIQVHNRSDYLMHLIDSLKNVQHINKSLIVFSHDYYDDKINSMILEHLKNSCAFMQIFYPFSNQIYLNKFPGEFQF
jgi:hypothetical protein